MSITAQRVHFVGVGGAGMSALAKVLIERGKSVSGSDLKTSRATAVLEAMGAVIFRGHDAANLSDAELVVVSAAIPPANLELTEAQRRNIPVVTRGEALAEVLEGQRSVIVAGTHGKTTTTSMLVSILLASGRDPTYLVGGGLNDVGTNARSGRDDIAIAESDESDGSFLLLSPHVAVITNVEADHLEHWGSLGAIRTAFEQFIERTDPEGVVVVGAQEPLAQMARDRGLRVLSFGSGGDVSAEDIILSGDASSFVMLHPGGSMRVDIAIPGLHNVDNALAAAAAALALGIDPDDMARGLRVFRGVERRWQLRGETRGVTVIDDYAHHPSEIRATLAAARAGNGRWERVIAVFQPHRYSRTAALQHEFGPAFAQADRVVVTDVYGAGEEPVPGVTGKLISDSIARALPGRPVAYLPRRVDLIPYLENLIRAGDAVLTLGAGDITAVGEELLEHLRNRT